MLLQSSDEEEEEDEDEHEVLVEPEAEHEFFLLQQVSGEAHLGEQGGAGLHSTIFFSGAQALTAPRIAKKTNKTKR